MKTEEELVKSLQKECDELVDKKDKLENFFTNHIGNETATDKLPDIDKELLWHQHRCMEEYVSILKARISLHTDYVKKELN